MAYGQDLKGAARRHLAAAQHLYDDLSSNKKGNKAVAGYLFGLAGELAIKQIMLNVGLRPAQTSDNDPFYKHFPELKTLLSQNVGGRLQGRLAQRVNDPRLFQNWDIKMRYAPTTEITANLTEIWKQQAEDLVADIEG